MILDRYLQPFILVERSAKVDQDLYSLGLLIKVEQQTSVTPERADVKTPGRKMRLGTHSFTTISVEKNRLQLHCKREH